MGVFDKLNFWKKKDDLGMAELDKSLSMPTGIPSSGSESNLGLGGLNSQPYSSPQQSYPSQMPPQYDYNQSPQSFQQDQAYTLQKEVEVISIKLDAIKAAIENISQRLANLERFAYSNNEQQQAPMPRQYYREFPPRSY